jgi:hypothetical protein
MSTRGEGALQTMPDSLSSSLPMSKELAGWFQEEFVRTTGLSTRWAAERVQGNRRLEQHCIVPFGADGGLRGTFSLHWDAELQRFLASRLGANAGRPEYLGAILRATAGRWASGHALRGTAQVQLQAAVQADGREEAPCLGLSSAALIIDSFVIELVFALESPAD